MRCASPPERVPGRPRQRQVVQPHVEQEAQPGVDLLDESLGDGGVALGELQARRRKLDASPMDRLDRSAMVRPATVTARLDGLQPRPAACGTVDLAHVSAPAVPRRVGLRLVVAPADEGNDTLVLLREGPHTAEAVAVADHHIALGAVQEELPRRRRQLAPRLVHREAVLLGQGAQHVLVV